jgi:hypothetical protein
MSKMKARVMNFVGVAIERNAISSRQPLAEPP